MSHESLLKLEKVVFWYIKVSLHIFFLKFAPNVSRGAKIGQSGETGDLFSP